MAKQKFVHFVPRPKPKKRPRRHTKSLNTKNEAINATTGKEDEIKLFTISSN